MTNHFERFELPQDFNIDTLKLEKAYHSLQQQYHPDVCKQNGLTEQEALTQSSQINMAYHTLLSPDTRACYLLNLAGKDAHIEQSIGDLSFLGQALELREELDEAENEEQLEAIKQEATQWANALGAEFSREFTEKDYTEACDTARKISFMVKLLADIQAGFDRFDDIDDLDLEDDLF